MCTATWMEGDRFRCFLFNRDERRTRSVEVPPRIHEPIHLPRFLAPTDPQSQGSWIAVNEYGLTAAILNHYDASTQMGKPKHPETISRGTLPITAVAHKRAEQSISEIAGRVQESHFEPFHLVLYSADGDGELLTWNGSTLTNANITEVKLPLTTSSWKSNEVTEFRRDLYQKQVGIRPKLHELLEFHGTSTPDQPAYGPAMVRDDAHTRSLTIVRLGGGEISMRHQFFDPENGTFLNPTEVRTPRKLFS